MTLDIVVATLEWADYEKCIESWIDTSETSWGKFIIVRGKPILEAYQEGFENSTADIIFYGHDDLLIFENGWDRRVLKEFEDPTVGMVGFGAGLGFGSKDLYKTPYQLPQLGRNRFRSNLVNAEDHGERFTGECDAACVDGFAMFIRRSILEKINGFPLGTPVSYFCYDMALSAEVRRQGYRTRLVGVSCNHLSGKTASMVQLKDDHAAAHLWLYENYKDVLPFEA
jgi:hypothetical protein